MAGIPYIPSSAPFTPEQRAWLNGYLAGRFSNAETGELAPPGAAAPAPAKEPLLVMYGSQTGSAEGLAKKLAKAAAAQGFVSRLMELNDYAKVDLATESRLVVVTSTWGDGEPPDNAVNFWNFLKDEAAPKLDQLNYAVLALGDKNYSQFCGAGKNFDERLAALGARRIHDRLDCDVDFETTAAGWIDGLWAKLKVGAATGLPETSDGNSAATGPASIAPNSATPKSGTLTELPWSRKNPFPAKLITNRKLNGPDSAKDTRHFEISLAGSGLTYEVGDALGVCATNDPALVADLFSALGCDGEEAVTDPDGVETSLRHALLKTFTITKPPQALLKELVTRTGNAELLNLLAPANQTKLADWLWGREIIDVLLACPGAGLSALEFTSYLAKLAPRLYSISSSPKAHPGEVHLTIGAVRYESHGRARLGVCSTFLADRVALGETPVPVFVQTSHGFRLPANGNTPIIMVGPGTGIAPFRAFLEERRAAGALGKNWLFFGDQRAACDYLYREELETMQAEGVLTRLDLAFSRDQPQKIYVQDRMLAEATELWSWLEAGAHFYVCGDAKRMAKDVDVALHRVVETVGRKSADEATAYVAQLKKDKRYQRDVY